MNGSVLKIWIGLLGAVLVAALAGCGSGQRATKTESESASPAPDGPLTADQTRAIAKEAYI